MFILRKIKQNNWRKSEKDTWILDDEIKADALNDLKTSENKLSLWYINEDLSNLDHVISAMASACNFLSHFDYVRIKNEDFNKLGISIEITPGDTPDRNTNQHHFDAVKLTTNKMLMLAKLIQGCDLERRRLKDVGRLIADGINEKRITLEDLSEELQADLRKHSLL